MYVLLFFLEQEMRVDGSEVNDCDVHHLDCKGDEDRNEYSCSDSE
jgi:hypothetical protein